MENDKRKITAEDVEFLYELFHNLRTEWLIILATARAGHSVGNKELASMLSSSMAGTQLTSPVALSRARQRLWKKRMMEKLRTFTTIYEMKPDIAERMKAILANAFEIKKLLDEEQIGEAAKKRARMQSNPGEAL